MQDKRVVSRLGCVFWHVVPVPFILKSDSALWTSGQNLISTMFCRDRLLFLVSLKVFRKPFILRKTSVVCFITCKERHTCVVMTTHKKEKHHSQTVFKQHLHRKPNLKKLKNRPHYTNHVVSTSLQPIINLGLWPMNYSVRLLPLTSTHTIRS